MTADVSTDILVIGAGPAGLHAAFYAGFRGLTVHVLEASGEPGGQLAALYPDRRVYDVPGHPGRRAAEIVAALVSQLEHVPVTLHLHAEARTLTPHGARWRVTSDAGTFEAGAVIVTAGLGALRPRALKVPGGLTHPNFTYGVPDLDGLAGQRVLIVGGVPQAPLAALTAANVAAAVTLTHSRAGFRGDPGTLAALDEARAAGRLTVLTPATLQEVTPTGGALLVAGQPVTVPADRIVILNGYVADLSSAQAWPLDWQGEYVPDGPGGCTVLPGVFVAGDVAGSGNGFKLISVALAQAAVAANHAAHHVRPDLRVRPGHSSEQRVDDTA